MSNINQSLENALHDRSRRDFLKTLCALAGAAILPAWEIRRADAADSIPVPPTLMLHSKDRWKLQNILAWLKDNQYNSITYAQFATVLQNNATLPEKPIILTIDDVGSHYIQPYYPQMIDLIEKAGYTGMLGIVTLATPSQKPDIWAILKDFAGRGWELDTHTTHHHDLPLVKTVDELRVEIVDSAKMMQDGIGQAPVTLVVPYANLYLRGGKFDQRIFDVSTEANLSFVIGMKEGRFVNPGDQPPIYLGRVGIGVDSKQTAWWITHFNIEKP